jgi:hypothetical protein
MKKCPYCKECLEFYFHDGLRIYWCVLCGRFFGLVLGKGLVELTDPPKEGQYNVPN